MRAREDVTLKEHIVDDSSRENVIRILKGMGQFERNNGELFKASSYFRAAKGIEGIPLTEESILAVKGIGKSLCKKILEIVDTGTCEFYEKIKDFKCVTTTNNEETMEVLSQNEIYFQVVFLPS